MIARFMPCIGAETTADAGNPWRGYYEMRRVDLTEGINNSYAKGGLVLLEARLPDAGSPLGAREREALERELCLLREAGRGCILRLLYDWDGECWQREPQYLSTILEHIDNLAGTLRGYGDVLFVSQGLLVGNWGEMHGSTHLAQGELRQIAGHMRDALPDETYLAMRRPMYRKMLDDIADIGLFNDALLSSADDMGTYRLDYERGLADIMTDSAPCGGETAALCELNSPENALEALRNRRITYLSGAHDPEVIKRWRDSGLYEIIGASLGYRFVISSAAYFFGEMKIYLTNTGFARLYRKANVRLIIGDMRVDTGEDASAWLPGEKRCLKIKLPKLARGSYPARLDIPGIVCQNESGNALGTLVVKF